MNSLLFPLIAASSMAGFVDDPDYLWKEIREGALTPIVLESSIYPCDKPVEIVTVKAQGSLSDLRFEGMFDNTSLQIEVSYRALATDGQYEVKAKLNCESNLGDCYHTNIMNYEPKIDIVTGCPK